MKKKKIIKRLENLKKENQELRKEKLRKEKISGYDFGYYKERRFQ